MNATLYFLKDQQNTDFDDEDDQVWNVFYRREGVRTVSAGVWSRKQGHVFFWVIEMLYRMSMDAYDYENYSVPDGTARFLARKFYSGTHDPEVVLCWDMFCLERNSDLFRRYQEVLDLYI